MNNKYLVFVGMGIELVGIIGGCLYVGQLLDQHFQSKGLIMVGLSAAGLGGWLYQIILLTRQIENSEKNENLPIENTKENGHK